jgi:hypothetical protein
VPGCGAYAKSLSHRDSDRPQLLVHPYGEVKISGVELSIS